MKKRTLTLTLLFLALHSGQAFSFFRSMESELDKMPELIPRKEHYESWICQVTTVHGLSYRSSRKDDPRQAAREAVLKCVGYEGKSLCSLRRPENRPQLNCWEAS